MSNAEKLARLYEECGAYFDGLYAPEKKVYVFGDGDAQAKIVMIGEAPGEQETLLGKPFVGKSYDTMRDLEAHLTQEEQDLINLF